MFVNPLTMFPIGCTPRLEGNLQRHLWGRFCETHCCVRWPFPPAVDRFAFRRICYLTYLVPYHLFASLNEGVSSLTKWNAWRSHMKSNESAVTPNHMKTVLSWQAFPNTPWIFVYRDPVPVMMSLLGFKGGVVRYSLELL